MPQIEMIIEYFQRRRGKMINKKKSDRIINSNTQLGIDGSSVKKVKKK